ncbi:tyrosine-type recombinase/integrase [Endozoicomonas ascidiicola]|uniref:tyrosine-type recombinase/integrase n=1 Tax=Endozoicomonas ascidiicola TaxID=1698521 RepID=UPI00082C46BC|nr:tyrosine-type recombinase/integrase [Endozoicomonas ascidiicola]
MTIQCFKRKRKTGIAYIYQVSVRKDHYTARESLSFPDKTSGKTWAKKVEAEMLRQAEQEEPEDLSTKAKTGDITLQNYLEMYRQKMASLPKDQQISYRDTLAIKFWERSWLAKKRSKEISDKHLIKLLDERLATVTPATNQLYVSVLRRAIDWQKRLGVYFKRFITEEVMKELWKLKLIGKSKEDDTRPTEEQVYLLYQAFLDGYNKHSSLIPYHHLMLFSIYSSFREGEICRIRHSDFDMENGLIIIRDRKDPKKKYSNHQKVPICSVCQEIIARQPRFEGDDRIFPYKALTVSVKFSERTKALGFPELRFHSFRHDGISRFFEQDMSIPEVALRSGHKTWDNLRRYTHLIHRNPPDLWGRCKAIEAKYWAENEVRNTRVQKKLQQLV